jgi:hypothetical protein
MGKGKNATSGTVKVSTILKTKKNRKVRDPSLVYTEAAPLLQRALRATSTLQYPPKLISSSALRGHRTTMEDEFYVSSDNLYAAVFDGNVL